MAAEESFPLAPSASVCLETLHPSWGCCTRVGQEGLLRGHSVQSRYRPRCPYVGAGVQGWGESPAQPMRAVSCPPASPDCCKGRGAAVPTLPVRMQSSRVTPELCRCSSSPTGSLKARSVFYGLIDCCEQLSLLFASLGLLEEAAMRARFEALFFFYGNPSLGKSASRLHKQLVAEQIISGELSFWGSIACAPYCNTP